MAPTMQPDAPTRTIWSYSPGWWPCASLVAELGRGHALITITKDQDFPPKSGPTGTGSRQRRGPSSTYQPNSSVLVVVGPGAAEPGLLVPPRPLSGRRHRPPCVGAYFYGSTWTLPPSM